MHVGMCGQLVRREPSGPGPHLALPPRHLPFATYAYSPREKVHDLATDNIEKSLRSGLPTTTVENSTLIIAANGTIQAKQKDEPNLVELLGRKDHVRQ